MAHMEDVNLLAADGENQSVGLEQELAKFDT